MPAGVGRKRYGLSLCYEECFPWWRGFLGTILGDVSFGDVVSQSTYGDSRQRHHKGGRAALLAHAVSPPSCAGARLGQTRYLPQLKANTGQAISFQPSKPSWPGWGGWRGLSLMVAGGFPRCGWDASWPQHLLEAGRVVRNENLTDGCVKKSAPFVLLLTT